ncbi:PGAP1-domain-containing protein [Gymnopus androsaceus JB14]|uniref:GPI inositol-deacylase n=1 Tax=Gymnopus androsaceus JB14 TaxID=1447944 RepID=A0A6A4I2Q0_9AGAR|nr:PGAP1-domain-containing protein [Gymnopus androsaceus JB14]
MMLSLITWLQGAVSFAAISLFLYGSQDVAENLSPQGCRMSYMNPSYIPQTEFNRSWTPLAERYSLLLYREDQWERELHGGTPVLFIPGNAGSSGQVRSIASSATRQYYSRPNVAVYELWSRNMKALDFFAVEFNEDLSAFHGPTLEAQAEYCSRAVSYILSMYPQNTSIIIMGHSMGGIVATSLLPSQDIAAIITMSTPHTLPPARFDQRVDEIYAHNRETLHHDSTPILSLCGGATDMMIPSESCILPPSVEGLEIPYRRTVFSSALEGAWTGVGHRQMVWCHQVRWRVARAAMELTLATSVADRGVILDKWLRDGHTLPPAENSLKVIPSGERLILTQPRGSRTYLLPSQKLPPGSIPPISPQKPNSLLVSVALCSGSTVSLQCDTLQPVAHKLIPNPTSDSIFPVPQQGTDESEGVVLFEAEVVPATGSEAQWVAVKIERSDGEGWVLGGFVSANKIFDNVSMSRMLLGGTTVTLPDPASMRTSIRFPRLDSNALLVYRVVPLLTDNSLCSDQPLLSPLLVHTSYVSETHYFPLALTSPRRILLHTHGSAPYIQSNLGEGVELVIYSAINGCSVQLRGFDLYIDWLATLGRWPSRYFTTIVCWAVGIVALVVYEAWGAGENDNTPFVPPVDRSLREFGRRKLPKLALASLLISLLPLPDSLFMGTSGEWIYGPIAPMMVLIASGLVCISWMLLVMIMWPIGKISHLFSTRRQEEILSARKSTLISMGLIFALIFFFIPWQVAYLCCWLIHLQSCASDRSILSEPVLQPGVAVPLLTRNEPSVREGSDRPPQHRSFKSNSNHKAHLLLLMTWLLPLAAPVLVVWVRTLVTAGLTTPFDGDHFFFNVAPFLILVDFASWTSRPLLQKNSGEKYFSARWSFWLVAAIAFFVGPRKTYYVFDATRLAIGALVVVRIGPHYWGANSWRFPK